MKRIIPLIQERQDRYRKHPFILFLQDESLSNAARLAYAPFATFFSMSFSEFNKYHITIPNARTPAEHALNEHAQEDEGHYKWFLRDLGTLGYDPECRFTDALRFIWSPEGQRARDLSHFLIGSAQTADAEMKLVILEAIEATGAVWLDATVKAVSGHPDREKLTYFNETHEDREIEFVVGGGHAAISQVELRDDTVARAPMIINGIFERMEAMSSEFLTRLQAATEGRDFLGRPVRRTSDFVDTKTA